MNKFNFNIDIEDNDNISSLHKSMYLNITLIDLYNESFYIDLDLPSGLLWCKYNLGAENEYDYGNYYAWGELTTKNEYTDENYTYKSKPIKLPSKRDVATQTLGKKYSIPTKKLCSELISYTCNKWVENYNKTGVNGILFTGKNGNSIFIPATGYRYDSKLKNAGSSGSIWSSNFNEYTIDCAWYMYFSSERVSMGSYDRHNGRTIRPVLNKN